MNRKWGISIVGFVLVIGIFLIGYINSQLQPVQPNAQANQRVIEIPKGSHPNQIAKILKENQLIKSEFFFRWYVRYTGEAPGLKAGKYELSNNMSLKEIVQALVEGNAILDIVRFTVPEGYTVEQIAANLSEQGIINKEKFLQLAKIGSVADDFFKQIPSNPDVKYKLEGYLFPKTYEVKKGATEEEIIKVMLEQFKKEWKPEWTTTIKKRKMDMGQIITLASIIEREVVVDKERPIVAGVLYNRLNDHWNLQVDATIQYILGKQKERLTYNDLKIDNPYNTYIYPGLPPGPISNPGIKSIEAAVSPTNNPYYFYVTKKDNTGEHYFSKTFAEHQKNDARSRK
ncbi:endolytic transglycosylase MltG [Tepidibacillus infernus]|uniref:endolytic transglycosylase MltG n=1 Tax=Tepidibacillus TaxID=1494427 RepID=UPI000855E3DB|nr:MULTISPECIES: endolytic transglycosylase MltG [Tepidibacillus]GBF10084.1 putative aminodeoxychorismate lyase [Tepidibacillus sp. HK-1]